MFSWQMDEIMKILGNSVLAIMFADDEFALEVIRSSIQCKVYSQQKLGFKFSHRMNKRAIPSRGKYVFGKWSNSGNKFPTLKNTEKHWKIFDTQ